MNFQYPKFWDWKVRDRLRFRGDRFEYAFSRPWPSASGMGAKPHGMDIAGSSAMLNGAQNRAVTAKTDSSFEPIWLIVSPTFIAVLGNVGVTITSTRRIVSLSCDCHAERIRRAFIGETGAKATFLPTCVNRRLRC